MKIIANLVLAAALASALPSVGRAAVLGQNLVVNGNAETGGTSGFTASGEFEARSYGSPGGYPAAGDPGVAQGGQYFFDGGFTDQSSGMQTISLSDFGALIDGGSASYTLSALLGGYSTQDDAAVLGVSFRDFDGASLGGSNTIGPVTVTDRSGQTGLLAKSATAAIPVNARFADLILTLTRAQGSANDGYADNLSFVVSGSSPVPPPVSAAPEPGAWALMIVGAGLAGLSLRRRRGPVGGATLAP